MTVKRSVTLPGLVVLLLLSPGVLRVCGQTDWKTAANARIEQNRKRDVRLTIVDASGTPVQGAAILIRQTRHKFAFGSAINNNIANPQYAAFFQTNFQWAVMENESKWYYNEPTRGDVSYATADAITNFCRTNGIILRGHCIFWAVDALVQQWVKDLSNPELLAALTSRLESVVNHFKGTFVHWDVNNEMLHGDYFGNRLGSWVNPWMFQYAQALDPDALLFVNDYNVVAGSETEAYKQQILGLLASNAPVHAIGVQGHFGATVDPATTESRLDSLAQLSLPIWITEYDSVTPDENVRADNLETLYRLAFSKPAVQGVLMWGFWAGSHWRGSAGAIVNLDWTLNEAGRRYQSLLSEWTTILSGTTDGAGGITFRGFHGSYDVVISVPGGTNTLRQFVLEPGEDTYVATLTPNGVVEGTQGLAILYSYPDTAVVYWPYFSNLDWTLEQSTEGPVLGWVPVPPESLYDDGVHKYHIVTPIIGTRLFRLARQQ